MVRDALFALICCGALTAASQSIPFPDSVRQDQPSPSPTLIPRSHEERESRYRAEHHVILNVLVVDASDQPIRGLHPDQFTVDDNGNPQKLASFREVNGGEGIAPAHTILMLDTVNGTSRDIEYEVKQLRNYLALHQGRLASPTSLAILRASGIEVDPSSSLGTTLAAESRVLFKDIQPYKCDETADNSMPLFMAPGHGDKNIGFSIEKVKDGACLNKKFQLSLTQLRDFVITQENTLGRVILVWIGPGWPRLSGPEFVRDTAQIKQNRFDLFVELSRILREAQVTVDAVYSQDLSRQTDQTDDKTDSQGVPTEEFATAASLSLRSIARQSGGRILGGKNMADSIARCSTDAETYYTLSFDSSPSSKPNEYHSLKVRVSKPGIEVLTTAAYFGEP